MTSAKPVFLQVHLRLMDCVFAVCLDVRDERVGEAALQEGTVTVCVKSASSEVYAPHLQKPHSSSFGGGGFFFFFSFGGNGRGILICI